MATMYPTQLDEGVERSERTVFEAFRDGLPDDWIVIHGRRYMIPAERGSRAQEGELDFLIIHPVHGLLGLEVKGGQEIGRDSDGWYTVPHHSSQPHRIKDPGRQAQNAVHNLLSYAKTQSSNPELSQLLFCYAVAFPGAFVDQDLGPALPRPLILDRISLRDPERALTAVYRGWGKQARPLSVAATKELVNILLPRLSLVRAPTANAGPVQRLGQTIAPEGERILRLTDEQMRILDTMFRIKRLGVTGMAGTGKTVVAMEKARRLAQEGKRVLFLCYNRLLAEALSGQSEGFDVRTFHSLCREVVRGAGLPFEPRRQNSQAFWAETAPEALLTALEQQPDVRWDSVIVDEGQDFQDLWWLAVEKLLVSERESTLWAFYDPGQDIFSGGSIEDLGLTQADLPWNCRNTQSIASVAYGFRGHEPRFLPGTPEGVEVEEIVCETEHEMLDAVRRSLHRLINEEGLTEDSVVVMTPRSERRSDVWAQGAFGNFRLVQQPTVPGPNEVCFTTISRFKGLEADAVILCEIDPSDRVVCSPGHLYVGASRAKHVLVLIKYDR